MACLSLPGTWHGLEPARDPLRAERSTFEHHALFTLLPRSPPLPRTPPPKGGFVWRGKGGTQESPTLPSAPYPPPIGGDG